MPKKKRPLKRAKKTRSRVSRKTKPKKPRRAKPTLKDRIARAKKLEALDAGKPTFRVLPRALRVAPDNVSTALPPMITGSVGRWEKGARNLQADVATVQRLLETAAQKLHGAHLELGDFLPRPLIAVLFRYTRAIWAFRFLERLFA